MTRRVTVGQVERLLGKGTRGTRGERRYSCPKCGTGGDDDCTFSVRTGDQVFYCYRCDFGRGRKLGSIYEALGREAPTETTVEIPADVPKEKKRPTRVSRALAAAFCPFPRHNDPGPGTPGEAALRYLLDRRGLDRGTIRAAGLGFGAAGSEWYGYCLFPVHTSMRGGKLLYYSGRAYLPDITLPQKNPGNRVFPVDAGEVLYGQERAPLLGMGVLCEAPLDALKVGPFALASYGKKLSDEQVELLRNLGLRKLVFLYDAEPEAQQYAWEQAARLFDAFPGGTFVAVPEGPDPGACSPDSNRRAVLRARPATPENRLRAAIENWHLTV